MEIKSFDLKDFYSLKGERGLLTCYLPTNSPEIDPDRKHPALLIIPGGAYVFVSEREAEPIALRFLPKGYCVFVLNYTCAPNGHYPVQLIEAAAAMHFIRTHAEEFAVDPTKVAAIGFSAGGHLAASLATMYNRPEVTETLRVEEGLLRPDAVLLSYPVLTAEEGYTHELTIQSVSGNAVPTNEDRTFFSLENHISSSTPPTFLWHTVEDGAVPVKNSIRFADKLSEAGVPFELHIYPFGGHGLSTADIHSAPVNGGPGFIVGHVQNWIDLALKWLDMTLGF